MDSCIGRFGALPGGGAVMGGRCWRSRGKRLILCLDPETPGSCGSIEFGCFAKCGSLKRVRIMNGLRTIGYYAFELCDALEELVIPESVTEIERDAIPSRYSLTVRVVPGSFAEQFCRNNGNQVVYQE